MTDGRWWSYLCTDPECCPPDGTPYEVASTAVAAMATLAGCVALPDREAVVRSLDPPTGAALDAFVLALKRANDRLTRLTEGVDDLDYVVLSAGDQALEDAYACYGGDGRLGDDELAWLCALVQLRCVRDTAWLRIDNERDGWKTHERLWTDALRRCPPDLAAPLGVLLAYTFWRGGEGLRASVAVERALAADPECTAALLMAEVLQRGLSPRAPDRAPHRRRKARPRARRRHKR